MIRYLQLTHSETSHIIIFKDVINFKSCCLTAISNCRPLVENDVDLLDSVPNLPFKPYKLL